MSNARTRTTTFTWLTKIVPHRGEFGGFTFNVFTPHGVLEAVEPDVLLNKRRIEAMVLEATGHVLRPGPSWWPGHIAELMDSGGEAP